MLIHSSNFQLLSSVTLPFAHLLAMLLVSGPFSVPGQELPWWSAAKLIIRINTILCIVSINRVTTGKK